MALDRTKIANNALQLIGGGRLLNIDTDKGVEADAVRDTFDFSLHACLSVRRWNRFSKRALLPRDVNKPAWGYETQHLLPADCIKVWEVAEIDRGGWVVEGDYLLTDLGEGAKIIYCAENNAAFDPLFNCVLAGLIAFHVASSLHRKEEQKAYQYYEAMLAKAARADAIEAPAEEYTASPWYEGQI